jgi:hypothetical protein
MSDFQRIIVNLIIYLVASYGLMVGLAFVFSYLSSEEFVKEHPNSFIVIPLLVCAVLPIYLKRKKKKIKD